MGSDPQSIFSHLPGKNQYIRWKMGPVLIYHVAVGSKSWPIPVLQVGKGFQSWVFRGPLLYVQKQGRPVWKGETWKEFPICLIGPVYLSPQTQPSGFPILKDTSTIYSIHSRYNWAVGTSHLRESLRAMGPDCFVLLAVSSLGTALSWKRQRGASLGLYSLSKYLIPSAMFGAWFSALKMPPWHCGQEPGLLERDYPYMRWFLVAASTRMENMVLRWGDLKRNAQAALAGDKCGCISPAPEMTHSQSGNA